jgi:hypothetical protein
METLDGKFEIILSGHAIYIFEVVMVSHAYYANVGFKLSLIYLYIVSGPCSTRVACFIYSNQNLSCRWIVAYIFLVPFGFCIPFSMWDMYCLFFKFEGVILTAKYKRVTSHHF